MNKPILYIDMDGVMADFDKAIAVLLPNIPMGDGPDYEERSRMVDEAVKNHDTFFDDLKPMHFAIEAVEILRNHFEIYFLSTPMCNVPRSYMGKRIWIQKQFGEWADKRLILTHRKDLVIGDYLIDDRTKNGAGEFKGELIQFGSDEYKDWHSILKYLL